MNAKSLAILKSFLVQSGREEQLLEFLPLNDVEDVQEAPAPASFSPQAVFSSHTWAEPIHFSWLAQTLKEYPPALQALFLGSLPEEQISGIQEMIDSPVSPKTPSPFIRPFVLDVFRKAVEEPDLLSREQLPNSQLKVLLDLSRKELLYVIDFLGIYDLAADIRQVVDKRMLEKIYKALRPEQIQFLQYCSKQPIKWVSAKLGLNTWDGSKHQLNHLLHYRGLIRLAKAVHSENAHFRWHLLHFLDVGRAKVIQKEFYQRQDPALAPYFKNQVLHVAKRYQS